MKKLLAMELKHRALMTVSSPYQGNWIADEYGRGLGS